MIGSHGILSVYMMKLYGWKLCNGGDQKTLSGGIGLKIEGDNDASE